MGKVQVKVALVTILSKSRVSLAPGTPRTLPIAAHSLTLAPVHGVKLTLSAR